MLAVGAALALGGCGSIHPGAAAVVGGTRITPDEVDDTAAVICLVDQSVGGVNATARQKAVDFLIGTTLVQQFGDSVGATPTGAQIAQAPTLATIQQDASSLPASSRQDYVDTITTIVTAQQTLVNAGRQAAGADAQPDAAAQQGAQAYAAWLKKNGGSVDVDPRYGTYNGQTLVPGDSSLSVAQSDTAKGLQDGSGSRPPSQVCS